MAFPTTSVIENFTGTNGASLDSDWSTLTGASAAAPLILSNAASNVSAFNPYIGAYWDVTTFGADSEAFITITEDGSYFGVFCRIANPTGSMNGYKAGWSDDAGGTVTLERVTAGASTTIDTASVAGPDVGDKLGVEAIGSTIKAYVNTGSGWTEVCSVTDATYGAAGYIGFDAYDPAAISLDDFGGGTVVGGGVAPSNTVAPVVSGTTQVGSLLSCTTGTWTGDATITYTYQWQNDTLGNGTFANISGATSSTYTLQAAEEGDDVRCRVTGTNGTGNSTASSNDVGPITAAADPGDPNCYVMTVGGLEPSVSRVMTSGGLFPPVA